MYWGEFQLGPSTHTSDIPTHGKAPQVGSPLLSPRLGASGQRAQWTVRHKEHPVGVTDCRSWLGWGIANAHVGPEQFHAF